MKDKFEFYGIQTKLRRELTKQFLKSDSLPPVEKLSDIVESLWKMPQREYQYFGIELLEKFIKKLDKSNLTLIEFVITNKSWWDTVDGIAIRVVGGLFRNYPDLVIPVTKTWISSGNIWLQRTAILFQLKYKSHTDTDLLFKYILELEGSDEFFINKAIGWALREHSKTDPRLVIKFVNSHNLSALSRREALKVINKRVQ
jgi:3-methyladenine DNA glycosylase AlkD